MESKKWNSYCRKLQKLILTRAQLTTHPRPKKEGRRRNARGEIGSHASVAVNHTERQNPMKTSFKNRNFKSFSFTLAAAAALAASSALADTMSVDSVPLSYTLNLYETSSTANLGQTYNGVATFTIMNVGVDMWTLTTASPNCTFFIPQTT